MGKPQHTKAPWVLNTYDPPGARTIVSLGSSDEFRVAHIYSIPLRDAGRQTRANVRLIVSAPELLEMLRRVQFLIASDSWFDLAELEPEISDMISRVDGPRMEVKDGDEKG